MNRILEDGRLQVVIPIKFRTISARKKIVIPGSKSDDAMSPRKETVSPENKIKTTVALNIFDPDSAPRREAGRNRPASNDTSTNNAKDPEAERKEQLRKAIEDQNELKELLKTLSKTPGATKEQTDLVRQRLERAGQEVRRLREQQKKPRP